MTSVAQWEIDRTMQDLADRLVKQTPLPKQDGQQKQSKRQRKFLEVAAAHGEPLNFLRDLASRQIEKATSAKGGMRSFWSAVRQWCDELEKTLKTLEDQGTDTDEILQGILLRCTAQWSYDESLAEHSDRSGKRGRQ